MKFSLDNMREYLNSLDTLQNVRAWSLSKHYGMADGSFHRLLKENNTTFMSELNAERERRLKQMVEAKVYMTNEYCAKELGFGSVSAYQTWSKNHFGMTPKQWRDQYER